MSPFSFTPPKAEFKSFKKLNDLPGPNEKIHSADDVMAAMKVLYQMVHAQSEAYGGENSKLYAAGIAETCSFKTFLNICEDISSEEQKRDDLYQRWKKLINMSASDVEKFKEKQTALGKKDPKKYPGLTRAQANTLDISSGVQSAEWIIKMKNTPVKDWTPEMWKWAAKQVSFVSRMLGNPGPLYDKDGEPTRKNLALLIWGHKA